MRQLTELEILLQQMIVEHRKLLQHVEAHQAAMKGMDLKAMDEAANRQEASRLRIATIETKRRLVVQQLARALKLDGEPTLARIAALAPTHGESLLKLRDDLRGAVQAVVDRSNIAGRLAGAVLGHLNTVVRVLAGAVQQAGVYTKHGVPQVSGRIGMMEAVG